jgi:prolipoprotein diacylglyceryltransferase
VWREPGFTVLGLSGGQLVSLPTIAVGVVLLTLAIRRGKRTVAAPA